MQYFLTLPKGKITFRNGMYQGSNTEAVWAPCNPNDVGGWQNGDTLTVNCTFNLNPTNVVPPPSTEYAGLCVGSCNAANTAGVKALISEAQAIFVPNPGKILGSTISTSPTPAPNAIFYNAKSMTGTFALQPASRGSLNNYIFQWTMTYNANNTIANGTDVEIVFGYGDPMTSEVDS